MNVPAGATPPAPHDLNDVATIHAMDGDSTELCSGDGNIEQINDFYWPDIPGPQRCPSCQMILDAGPIGSA